MMEKTMDGMKVPQMAVKMAFQWAVLKAGLRAVDLGDLSEVTSADSKEYPKAVLWAVATAS